MDALKEYKRENSKFFEVKERYKGAIAALEKDLQVGRMRAGIGCHLSAAWRRAALISHQLRSLLCCNSTSQDKERERQELLGLCNELMTRLEREGLSAA